MLAPVASPTPLPEPQPLPNHVDLAVIGAGLVGLATARALTQQTSLRVAVLETEDRVAAHQSGHNSGVIHAGLYYEPGSLRARLCRAGRAELLELCASRGLPWRTPGKLVVAVHDDERPRLSALHARGLANGLEGLELLDATALARLEPELAGVAALLVPETGITDYRAVARALADELIADGASVDTGRRLLAVRDEGSELLLTTSAGPLRCRHLVACAGLQADRVARLCGVPPGVTIVPFRGQYRRLVAGRESLVRHLVYPVPDPSLPFLGVHFTPTVDGRVEIGPDAVLALARHGYRRGTLDLADLWAIVNSPGAWRLVRRLWRRGFGEWLRARSEPAALAAMQRLLPGLGAADVEHAGSGVRAQAVTPAGELVDDFLVEHGPRSLHVLNAPSPAATASLAIGRHVAGLAREAFSL